MIRKFIEILKRYPRISFIMLGSTMIPVGLAMASPNISYAIIPVFVGAVIVFTAFISLVIEANG